MTNNYVLGNTLRLLYENKYNNTQQSEQKNNNPEIPNSEYVFSLLGLEFSGKHLAAL